MTSVSGAWWRRLIGQGGQPAKPRIDVRFSDGSDLVLEADTAEPLFDLEEQLTDPRPGFTELPAAMVTSGHRARINRAHIVLVRIR